VKRKYLIISSISLALLLSACGGGSGSTTFEGSGSITIIQCDNSNSAIATNDCGDSTTPDYYTCLKSNDTLVSENDNTLLEIIDKADGSKKVCIKDTTPSGAAHIVRGN